MKAYLITTGAAFGLLALIHVWRIIEEGPGVANPWFILITVIAAVLSLWAWRLFRLAARS